MPVEKASLGKICTSCGRNNANALKFCLTCGLRFDLDLVQVYGPNMSSPSFCKRCGIDDPCNEKYCIVCGDLLPERGPAAAPQEKSDLAQPQAAQPRNITTQPRTRPPDRPIVQTHKRGITSGALFMLLAVCGSICGFGAAYMLKENQYLEYAATRLFWPRAGLVVYVKPSNCQASVSTLDRRHLLLTRADPHGNVNLSSLVNGDYRLTLTAPGCQTVAQIVRVAADRPTILGYPYPVTLPKRVSSQP